MTNRHFKKNVALTALTQEESSLVTLGKRHKILLNALFQSTVYHYFLKYPELADMERSSITLAHVEERTTTVRIDENVLMGYLGYKGRRVNNKGQVMELLEDLSDAKLGIDGFGIARPRITREQWEKGFSVLVGSAYRENGNFNISIPPVIIHRIINPEVAIEKAVGDWSSFKSKHTPDLIDVLQFFKQRGEEYTDWFDIETIRQGLGITAFNIDEPASDDQQKQKSYWTYGKINANIFEKIKLDLQRDDSIDFTFEPDTKSETTERKVGNKSVTHVRFRIIPKVITEIEAPRSVNHLQEDVWGQRLEELGIAKNQITKILNEIDVENEHIKAEFMNWALAKGEHYSRLKLYSEEGFNFGGWFRKNILRNGLKNWALVRGLLVTELQQNYAVDDVKESHIRELKKRCKRDIATQYLALLSERVFVNLKGQFERWLSDSYSEKVHNEDPNFNLSELNPDSTLYSYFMFFLETEKQLFKPEHYREVLTPK